MLFDRVMGFIFDFPASIGNSSGDCSQPWQGKRPCSSRWR
jgi:hypothetical protein